MPKKSPSLRRGKAVVWVNHSETMAHTHRGLSEENPCISGVIIHQGRQKIHLGLAIWKYAFLTQLFLPFSKQYFGLRRIFSHETSHWSQVPKQKMTRTRIQLLTRVNRVEAQIIAGLGLCPSPELGRLLNTM